MTLENVAGLREGDVLLGKYRVDKILGAGGMGVVVAAHHVDLDERVAIKFLLPEIVGHTDAVVRFMREARAAVRIKSEHVAKVTDVGKLENGAPYMVMEYLDGSDLSAWLARSGPLPIEQAVDFVLQASEAIAEAHSVGIVHRDLKPANLFIVRRPDGALSTKVLDFGISKMAGRQGSDIGAQMTKTSALMGSPLYMSPEQMQSSKDVDARGDIWALGVILYELVAGATPFTADTMPELVLRVVQGAPAPLAQKRPDVPPGLEQVILKCLAKDRSTRYENVGELAVALLPFAPKRSKISVERISGVLRTVGVTGAATALPPSSDQEAGVVAAGTAASWGKTAAPPRRAPWLWVGAGIAVVGGAGALALRAAGKSDGAELPIQPPAVTAGAAPDVALPKPSAPAPAPAPAPVAEATTAARLPAGSVSPGPAGSSAAKPTGGRPKPVSGGVVAKPSPKKVDIFDERK